MTTTTNKTKSIVDYVDVNGSQVRFSMAEARSPEGPPVLLINGLGARLEMWQPLSSAISDRTLLMFDFPGITGRAAHDLPLEMPGLARWLARLLDVLNISVVDVIGYSWGGVLAQQFARDLSERVRALVLVSTNFGFGAVSSPAFLPLLNLMPSDQGDDPWKLLTAALGGATGSRDPIGAIVNALKPSTTPFQGYQRQCFSLAGWTSLNWLHELTAPTLVLAGDDDPFVPTSISQRLAQCIPQGQLELIRGGGHLLPTNQPARVARSVEDFLGRINARG
jgi:pimeloyl-ACP methyl ester carboxylesterase